MPDRWALFGAFCACEAVTAAECIRYRGEVRDSMGCTLAAKFCPGNIFANIHLTNEKFDLQIAK
jgi:hypothetical protein